MKRVSTAALIMQFMTNGQRNIEGMKAMKTYIYRLLFSLALLSVPAAHAGQAPDTQLDAAQTALEEAFICVPEPYYNVQCMPQPGGGAEVRFENNSGLIVAQALQAGSAPREWLVDTFGLAFGCVDGRGEFTSMGQGFHPWKRAILDACEA